MDDARLWQEIRSAAQRFGYTLPANQPGAEDMAKIRDAMKKADKLSPMDVARLLTAFKAKKSKE